MNDFNTPDKNELLDSNLNTRTYTAVEKLGKFIDSYIGLAIGFILVISCTYAFIYSGKNPISQSQSEPIENQLSGLSGDWFLQPIEKRLSLNLATLHTVITLKIIDSVYCNVNISSNAGNVDVSRIYKIKGGQFIFDDPINEKERGYDVDNANETNQTFTLCDNGIPLFKVYPLSSVLHLLNTENTLKRNEFLYPTLNAQERESGLSQVVEEDGRFKLKEHFDKEEISKLDIYKMF